MAPPRRILGLAARPAHHVAEQRPGRRAAGRRARHGLSDRRSPGARVHRASSGSAAGKHAGVAPQPGGERCAGAGRGHHLQPGAGSCGGRGAEAAPRARLGPPSERGAPFGRVLELETAGPRGLRGLRGCGVGHLEGVGGRAGRGRKAVSPWGSPLHIG